MKGQTEDSADSQVQSSTEEKAVAPADPKELANYGPTPQGIQRSVIISTFYLCVALLVGVPVWLHTTATYQAALPFVEIRNLCSRPVEIAIRLNLVQFTVPSDPSRYALDNLRDLVPEACKAAVGKLPVSKLKYNRLRVTCSVGHIGEATADEKEIASKVLHTPVDHAERHLTHLEDELLSAWAMADGADSHHCPSVYPDCYRPLAFTLWLLPSSGTPTTFSSLPRSYLSSQEGRNLIHLFWPANTSPDARELSVYLANLVEKNLIPLTELMFLSSAPRYSDSKTINPAEVSPTAEVNDFSQTMSRQLPPSSVYDITITLLNRHPESNNDDNAISTLQSTNWITRLREDPTAWLNKYVGKAFEPWLPFVRLDMRSQTLHAVHIEQLVPSKLDESSSKRYYTRDDLSTVVNQLESYLGVTQTASRGTRDLAGTSPGLHIILLLDQSTTSSERCSTPLRFRVPRETDAAIVPQWGGLFIVENACPLPNTTNFELNRTAEALLGAKVVTVMRSLLGLTTVETDSDQLPIDYVPSAALSRADMDSWFMRRMVENLLNIKTTMASLVDLLFRFPNMMINDNVATEVTRSVQVWTATLFQLNINNAEFGGRVDSSMLHGLNAHLGSLFTASQNALDSINTAFFDHTLLARLYFPESQKFGIYAPLFLPLCLGILMSFKNALRAYYRNKDKTE